MKQLAADADGLLSGNVRIIRILRVARVIRVVRVVKIVRFIRALRSLVHSIFGTLKVLMWSVLLLVMLGSQGLEKRWEIMGGPFSRCIEIACLGFVLKVSTLNTSEHHFLSEAEDDYLRLCHRFYRCCYRVCQQLRPQRWRHRFPANAFYRLGAVHANVVPKHLQWLDMGRSGGQHVQTQLDLGISLPHLCSWVFQRSFHLMRYQTKKW